MQSATSFLKTAGVLVALWVLLFAVGFGLGAIPPGGRWIGGATRVATADGGTVDGSTADAAEPDAGTALALDAGVPGEVGSVEPSAPVSGATDIATSAVCAEPSVAPSLALLSIGGDARPEIVVGCGDTWVVIATGVAPTVVARIHVPPSADAGLSPRASAPVSLDFDADGAADLALPFVRYGAGGATAGGGLYVVRGAGWNVLGEVRALAPIAAAAVASGNVDGVPGADLVAVSQANPFARLVSEGWAFSGGASPRRTAVLRAATGGSAVALADVDVDGFVDVAITSTDDGRLDVFFGDGAGLFPRRRSFDVASADNVLAADLDGDTKLDLVIEGSGLSVMMAGPDAGLTVTPLPNALRDVVATDTDGDRRAELSGLAPPGLVSLHRSEDGTYEARTFVELSGAAFGMRRHAYADLDGDGAAEIVVLGTRAEAGGRMLELMVISGTTRGVVTASPGAPVADAPWVIDVPLPEAQPL